MRLSPNVEPLREANPCHTPAGSPQGGQFCSQGGGVTYHGTTKKAAINILREGISASMSGRMWPYFAKKGLTYVSDDRDRARSWALEAVNRSNISGQPLSAAVVKVRVPPEHAQRLRTDRNFGAGSRNFEFEGDIPPDWIEHVEITTKAVRNYGDIQWARFTLRNGKLTRLREAASSSTLYAVVLVSAAAPLREANSCHEPAGSPKGGQFCSKPFQRREDAIGPWTEESFNDGSRRRREKAWEAGIKRALTFGRLSLAEAKQLGFNTSISEETIGPLPDVLYHVTTNADAVLKSRLKTRAELAQQSGLGLGGGDDDTISFTTDPKIAQDIYEGLHLMRDVAAGDISGRQLKAWALAGDKAGRPFWDDIKRSWGGRAGSIELALDGFVPFSSENAAHRDALAAQMQAKAPELSTAAGVLGGVVKSLGWRLAPGAGSWDTASRGPMYPKTDVWVPGTAREQRDARVTLAKSFLFWRDHAGGPTDPLFFLSDTEALSRKPKSDFAILTVRPRKGAIGHRVGGLKEWRTWHGAAVRVESARRPSAER